MVTPVEVSVVMSGYNGEHYLSETIESILNQEGVSFEFIIVDDGSNDGTPEIIHRYAKKDTKIRVIRQENQGLTKALIKGCSRALGQYIARQDVGDVSQPGRLMLQKAALDADPTISFVSSWTEYCGPELEFLFLQKGKGGATLPGYIISEQESHGVIDGPTHHGSVMFRKDIYEKAGGYRAEFYFGQDWDLWYRLAERGKFYMLEQTLYTARITPESISAQNKKMQDTIGRLSREALLRRTRVLPEKAILEKAQEIRPSKSKKSSSHDAAYGLYFIGELLRRNDDVRAYAYLRRALAANPLYYKAWYRLLQIKLAHIRA